MKLQGRLRQLSIVLICVFLVVLAVHMESIVSFNRRDVLVHGNDSSAEVRMEIDFREDSTSSWLKRSFQMEDGTKVDLKGQTIDGTLVNRSGDEVLDWELRINIEGDCYINQAWNGEVEIHQYTGTDREMVQRLNLQSYSLSDVLFDYRYDGDLLIPLKKGDYVLYYPSTRFSEMPVAGGEDTKIGTIFYYLDHLDLTNYDLKFHYHREFTQGITFYLLVALGVLWLVSLIMRISGMIGYRRARKELELRKSGILSMSGIYDIIYIIHLENGEITPVSADEEFERKRAKDLSAKDLLTNLIEQDAVERYREPMLDFVNTDTLAQRLEGRSSIVSEFCSKQYGWCSMRFYAMDRKEGQPLEDVILTLQNINDEKKELEAFTNQIDRAESITKARDLFLDSLSDEMQTPLRDLRDLTSRILEANREEPAQAWAREAHGITSRLLMMTDGIADSADIEAGKLKPAAEEYSLRKLIGDVTEIVRPLAEHQHMTQEVEAAENLPDRLQGDPRLLREILVNQIFGMLSGQRDGRIQLVVYAKTQEAKTHLLFTVRVFTEENAAADEGAEETSAAHGLSLEIAAALLQGMGSDLRSVRMPAGRLESYFEIEQPVLDSGSGEETGNGNANA